MPMATMELVRDAGPLVIDDELIQWGDDDSSDREVTACLADPWVTATTRIGCDWNS